MVALPRKWIRELLDSINDVGDVERSRFIAKLQRYKEDRIIQSGSPYDPQMSWVDNVKLLETQGIVDAILVSQDSCRKTNACKYHTPDDIDEEFFSGNREIRCMGTAQNLSLAADVFLEVSSEVRFIDPYFRIATSSYLDTLIAFTKLATASGRCGIFSIFTRQEEMPKGGYKTINKLLDDNLAKIMPDGFKVIIFFIDTSTKINFHARYLLAAKGGLRYDKGFGVSTYSGNSRYFIIRSIGACRII